ncbi:hypothetical protein [Candidatus Babela massiliensis]|uniref:Uncharacterized protein n=1 Tax=Candidatus Babela massiliensis TaxID=673862 RepID=V6DGZ6_9BACT|nr:hypothetical protein [Candidatus Babela massiliensis]CDK30835.1 hypothetical protein BABL1_gene_179 [Candidatus Babela massiliensis]
METEKKYYGFMTKKQYIILSVVIYAAIALYLGSEFLNSLSPQTMHTIETLIGAITGEIIKSCIWAIQAGIITYVVTKIIRRNLLK